MKALNEGENRLCAKASMLSFVEEEYIITVYDVINEDSIYNNNDFFQN